MSGFGYQTFLYGSEAEVRKVLMFLLEKIRLEEEDDEEAGIGAYKWLHSIPGYGVLLDRQGPDATLGQQCPQMTQRPGIINETLLIFYCL